MFLKSATLKKAKALYTTPKSKYIVIENTKREIYDDLEVVDKEHLPNYLIVNKDNGAIESATDQFPSACHMSCRLEEELEALNQPEEKSPSFDDMVRIVN